MWKGSMEVKDEKKIAQKSKRSTAKKTLILIQCWLTKGQDLDEHMQAILWTEIDCGTMLVNRGSGVG
jgi:hypothetical protein